MVGQGRSWMVDISGGKIYLWWWPDGTGLGLDNKIGSSTWTKHVSQGFV